MSTGKPNGGMLTELEDLEAKLRGMIVGVLHFVFIQFPALVRGWLHGLIDWLGDTMCFLVKFAVRAARVLFFLGAWVALVFGPLFLIGWHSGLSWLVIPWTLLGLTGSVWGARRWRSKRKDARSAPKPVNGGESTQWKTGLAFALVPVAILLSQVLLALAYYR